ncbi:MAG TPA: hypothetical protein PLB66_03265 [Bacteroidales bacterium]|nr:hypothetical protein [Bacteroidales bacterium]HOS57633.1 hypothetical protein [Bacteroidales bacterium]
MDEIRIYYECLEQGYHYIFPIIKEVVHASKIKLVKRPKKHTQFENGALKSIMLLTTPDTLITAIKNGIEYPLVNIEFSEAVTTEDHELQRTYGAVASFLSDLFYIKISGNKESDKVFGGAEYNPFSTPKILIEKHNYYGYIIAEWGVEKENKYNLLRNKQFPSCPPKIEILKDAIQISILSFNENHNNWYVNAVKSLQKKKSYQKYIKKVYKASGANELLSTWQEREKRSLNLNRLRYFVRKDWISAKINRFSHAMDPDRGILTFISFVFSDDYKIFGTYALVRQRGNDVMKADLTCIESLKTKLKEAIDKDAGGVPEWFAYELIKVVKSAKTLNETINFHPVWEKHKDKIAENKVVSTLAYFLDGMYLNHNGIKLVWDRKKLLGNSKKKFVELLAKSYFSKKYVSAQSLISETDEVDEDEVTYTIAHKVLIPNGFRIVSISYPGSQGGGAVLPEPDLGKGQPRQYPDIIALPPTKSKNTDVILNESKGMYSKSSVEKDTEKILKYKTDKNLQRALTETLLVAQVIDKDDKIRNIIIGVAFGVKSNTPTTWKPDKVDFIFRITDRRKWAIGIFNQKFCDLIPIIEGETNFPKVFKLEKEKRKRI